MSYALAFDRFVVSSIFADFLSGKQGFVSPSSRHTDADSMKQPAMRTGALLLLFATAAWAAQAPAGTSIADSGLVPT